MIFNSLIQFRLFSSGVKTRKVKFQNKEYEIPEGWSDTAARVMISKYMAPDETSALQVFTRIAKQITEWGQKDDYFANQSHSAIFEKELISIMASQIASFNSPVLFNLGRSERNQQASACFILDVKDSMESILDHAKKEGMIFKKGSGTGCNYSSLRGKGESLSGGGTSSGVMSFLKSLDAVAGSIKQGGSTRRAARLAMLNVDHPDIEEFIECKAREEDKVKALIKAGFSGGMNGEAVGTAAFQNTNHSVSVTDDFMKRATEEDSLPVDVRPASDLLDKMAKAAWKCGDPGLFFVDNVNKWNTCKSSMTINSCNACQPAEASLIKLVENVPVLTTMGHVKVGDKIWTGEKFTSVVRKVSRGLKPVYRFDSAAGHFLGTDDHLIVEKGNWRAVGKANAMDTARGPDMPGELNDIVQNGHGKYIMDGLVQGGGSAYGASNNLVGLHIGNKDRCYFDDRDVGPLIIKHQPGIGETFYLIETSLTEPELPLAYNRSIPDRYFFAPPKIKRAFLRGLFSANGSVLKNGRISLRVTSFTVVQQVQLMLSSLGIGSYWTMPNLTKIKFKNGTHTNERNYELNIGRDKEKFRDLIGFIHPCKQERLLNVCDVEKGGWPRKAEYFIKNREFLGEKEVFDITVLNEKHRYWTGGVVASNCGEIVFCENSACNLAAINILKLKQLFPDDLDFINTFYHIIRVLITAMDIICGNADYPTDEIAANSIKYRPLGLGITNLGAYLMQEGLPYGHESGRNRTSVLMSFLTGAAYEVSVELAGKLGRECEPDSALREVLEMHAAQLLKAKSNDSFTKRQEKLVERAVTIWDSVIHGGSILPRNTQVTTCMPTGSVSFLMDCESTGIEPVFAPSIKRTLMDGTVIEKELDCVKKAKIHEQDQYGELSQTAIGPNPLLPSKHLEMMKAIQPYISGGISKTINLPNNVRPRDIRRIFVDAWKMGLKSVTVYRDGSKASQPLEVGEEAGKKTGDLAKKILRANFNILDAVANQTRKEIQDECFLASSPAPPEAKRKRLPRVRKSFTHKFKVGNHAGYITAGMYEDGRLGEVFVSISKEGSTLGGLMNAFSIIVSIALQYGVPLKEMARKMKGMRFEPAGFTGDPDIRSATSIVDYIFNWLLLNFGGKNEKGKNDSLDNNNGLSGSSNDASGVPGGPGILNAGTTGICPECGSQMVTTGSCRCCGGCGFSEGCS